MKKEILITILSGLILCAMICTLTGCLGCFGCTNNSKSEAEIVSSFNSMEVTNSCLLCLGCAKMQSSADCCGNVKYSYSGCIDCFGITTSEDTTPEDIYSVYHICNGMYCVNIPLESGDKTVPVYGCYIGS